MFRNTGYAIAMTMLVLLSGCATNFASISTFADSTTAVSSQASDTIGRIAFTCHDTVALVDQQLSMLSDVRDKNKRLLESPPPNADRLRLRTIQEGIEKLIVSNQKARSEMDAACAQDEIGQKEAIALVNVLKAYASALSSLAKDEFTTYPSSADSLVDSIGKFKSGGTAVLNGDKIGAIQSLNKFIYSMAVSSYRQREFSKALSASNRDQVALLIDAIDKVSDAYTLMLNAETEQIKDLLNTADVFQKGDILFEPIASVEMRLRLLALKSNLEVRLKALDDYRNLVKRLSPELENAAKLIDNPSAKDIEAQLLKYAQDAEDVRKKLNKAF